MFQHRIKHRISYIRYIKPIFYYLIIIILTRTILTRFKTLFLRSSSWHSAASIINLVWFSANATTIWQMPWHTSYKNYERLKLFYCCLFQHKKNLQILKDKLKWVSDCCLMHTQQFFQLHHGENKLIFNEMMMRSALYKTNMLII
jgi:hypothetical protein